MKYCIKGRLAGTEVEFGPVDDDGPDHGIAVYTWDNMDTEDKMNLGPVVIVKASELYGFFDWLQSWCPDPRQASERKARGE